MHVLVHRSAQRINQISGNSTQLPELILPVHRGNEADDKDDCVPKRHQFVFFQKLVG